MGAEFKTDFSDAVLFRAMQDMLAGSGQAELMQAVNQQTLYFIGTVQRQQMSGQSGDRYLNVRTGNLRRSWFAKTSVIAGALKTEAYTNVKYAAIHEYGGVIHRPARQAVLSFRKGRFVSPSRRAFESKAQGQSQQKVNVKGHDVHMKKRLFVVEEFEKQMPERYRKAITVAIQKVIHG